jgi:NAD(P)-dependent dehydrogenase (short-subunit alcohol dehydrogenase family)
MKVQKVAVITGGASGIGLAITRLLARKGWNVIQADKNGDVYDFEPNTNRFVCDVSSPDDIDNLFEWVRKERGRLDLLVTCAGVHSATPIEKTSVSEFERLSDVNMRGVWLTCEAAMSLLIESNGSIVTIGSDVALLPDKDAILYSASKAWVVNFTKALALYGADHGFRANCVCPGQTDTPFLHAAFGNDRKAVSACAAVNPMKRMATPHEIAKAIWMVHDNAFMNGAVVPVDGGYSIQAVQEPPKP